MLTRSLLLLSSLAVGLFTTVPSHIDRRVVDTVSAGDAESEATHGYAGHDDFTGVSDNKPFRQARGWMRYALTTFDDTPVTVACTFVSNGHVPRSYDVIVEDSLVATRTFISASVTPVVVEIAVPFNLTKGRTDIAVFIRARGGLTPALRELRTIQDHYEVAEAGSISARRSATAAQSSRSQNPFGVAR